MAELKVFVSSTCYDLSQIRHQMHSFLTRLGHSAVLSENSDILYDPRNHTHESCVEGVGGADMIVLFIGSRYGGQAIPEVAQKIDWSSPQLASGSIEDIVQFNKKLSITQLEVLSAIIAGIPIFPLVDEKVMHDHFVYEKNKNNEDVISALEFPSLEKQETAKYIFEFINFLKRRPTNNAIETFSKFEDVEKYLSKQWSSMFQKLLRESLSKRNNAFREDMVLEKIEALQTAVMSTISDTHVKNIARYVMQFRRLFDFMIPILGSKDRQIVHTFKGEWRDVLGKLDVVTIETRDDRMWPTVFILKDRTYFKSRLDGRTLKLLESDWSDFIQLKKEDRKIVYETLAEGHDRRSFMMKYIEQPYIEEKPNYVTDPFEDEIPF